MELLSKTRSFTTEHGIYKGTIWHFVPYRTLATEMVIQELNALYPQVVYTHKTTGKRTTTEPPEHREALERARKLKSPIINSDWTEHSQWNTVHFVFWQVEPVTMQIDFPEFDAHTPSEVRIFAEYWQQRPADIAERWEAFQAILGTETANAWAEAYGETRDTVLQTTMSNGANPEKKSRKTAKDAAPS